MKRNGDKGSERSISGRWTLNPTSIRITWVISIVRTMTFLKSPDLRTIRIWVIFNRLDFRIIQITNFRQKFDILSNSDILYEV